MLASIRGTIAQTSEKKKSPRRSRLSVSTIDSDEESLLDMVCPRTPNASDGTGYDLEEQRLLAELNKLREKKQGRVEPSPQGQQQKQQR